MQIFNFINLMKSVQKKKLKRYGYFIFKMRYQYIELLVALKLK